MVRRRLKNPLFLFYLLVAYVVAQFSWWLYLIASLYDDIYTDQVLLEKKTLMLVGEGSVFVVILFGGAFMIERAYRKENILNRLEENFLLSVSHELKTPVSSIKLFLQTLQKRDLDDTKREEIYAMSLGEIQRLEGLVSNLLITRSIENRNYFLNKTPLQLAPFIEGLVAKLNSSILKNHVVKCRLEAAQINADEEAMTSILTNLLQNAAKYSPGGSEIQVNLRQEKNEITLEIADHGIGINDHDKNFVFNRFYRAENEMTRKSKGTGLGLFITRFLVEQHQGRIALHDNKPAGLSVIIHFKKTIQ
jgi:two-component system, OmpR family, phosphate regulon sensor histidine kinase PhoR